MLPQQHEPDTRQNDFLAQVRQEEAFLVIQVPKQKETPPN